MVVVVVVSISQHTLNIQLLYHSTMKNFFQGGHSLGNVKFPEISRSIFHGFSQLVLHYTLQAHHCKMFLDKTFPQTFPRRLVDSPTAVKFSDISRYFNREPFSMMHR